MRTHKFAQKSGTTTSLATFTERKRRNEVSSVLGVVFCWGVSINKYLLVYKVFGRNRKVLVAFYLIRKKSYCRVRRNFLHSDSETPCRLATCLSVLPCAISEYGKALEGLFIPLQQSCFSAR